MTQPMPSVPPDSAWSTEPAIETRDVVCQFGNVFALGGVSLRVDAGTVMGVVGPNGAGKTTIIDVICGLVRPTSKNVMRRPDEGYATDTHR